MVLLNKFIDLKEKQALLTNIINVEKILFERFYHPNKLVNTLLRGFLVQPLEALRNNLDLLRSKNPKDKKNETLFNTQLDEWSAQMENSSQAQKMEYLKKLMDTAPELYQYFLNERLEELKAGSFVSADWSRLSSKNIGDLLVVHYQRDSKLGNYRKDLEKAGHDYELYRMILYHKKANNLAQKLALLELTKDLFRCQEIYLLAKSELYFLGQNYDGAIHSLEGIQHQSQKVATLDIKKYMQSVGYLARNGNGVLDFDYFYYRSQMRKAFVFLNEKKDRVKALSHFLWAIKTLDKHELDHKVLNEIYLFYFLLLWDFNAENLFLKEQPLKDFLKVFLGMDSLYQLNTQKLDETFLLDFQPEAEKSLYQIFGQTAPKDYSGAHN